MWASYFGGGKRAGRRNNTRMSECLPGRLEVFAQVVKSCVWHWYSTCFEQEKNNKKNRSKLSTNEKARS